MAYVDLNPIWAQIAATPETSRFTSVFERIQAEREASPPPAESVATMSSAERLSSTASSSSSSTERPVPSSVADGVSSSSTPASGRKRRGRADWLSPLPLAREVADEHRDVAVGRASNKGCLPMSLVDYLQLLDWTGRQLRRDKRGAIPSDVAPILQRLKVTDDGWLHLVKDFSRMFHRAAGTPTTLSQEATRRGHRWLKGVGSSRATFA